MRLFKTRFYLPQNSLRRTEIMQQAPGSGHLSVALDAYCGIETRTAFWASLSDLIRHPKTNFYYSER